MGPVLNQRRIGSRSILPYNSVMPTQPSRSLTIQVTPELEQRLEREAAGRGVTVEEYVRGLLAETPQPPSLTHSPDDRPADLYALAAAQGAPLAARFEDLLGDFAPEDETADEFDAIVRRWRREGSSQAS
jgi:hypothetical protein